MAYHTGDIFASVFAGCPSALPVDAEKKADGLRCWQPATFFWICSGKLVLYLLGTTLFTHYIAVWISWIKTKCNDETAGMQRTEAGTIKKNFIKRKKK